MSVRVKCNDVGCDKCTKGVFGGNDSLGNKLYYCKIRKCILQETNAKDCKMFRCKSPDDYSCKTCRRGK